MHLIEGLTYLKSSTIHKKALYLVLILTDHLTSTVTPFPPLPPSLSESLIFSSHLSELELGLVQDTVAPKLRLGWQFSSPAGHSLPGSPLCSGLGVWPLPNSEEEGTRYSPSIFPTHCIISTSRIIGRPCWSCTWLPLTLSEHWAFMYGSCLPLTFLSRAAAFSLPVPQIS